AALDRGAKPPPSDGENVAALRNGAAQLRQIAGDTKGPGADAARRLADAMTKLADSDAVHRTAVEDAFVVPLKLDLAGLRGGRKAGKGTRANLPTSLTENWVASGNRARVEIVPKGDSNDDAVMRQFARAVLKAAPTATGQGISTFEWGDTIVHSFEEAAAV